MIRIAKTSVTVAAIITACAIVPVSLLRAKPKNPTDQDVCSGKQTAVYGNCLNNGGSEDQCWKASLRRYNQCMQAKGHAAGTYAPIMASPTPKPGASIKPINGIPTTIKSGKATPTPSPHTPTHNKHNKG